jgi:hypothetical protein
MEGIPEQCYQPSLSSINPFTESLYSKKGQNTISQVTWEIFQKMHPKWLGKFKKQISQVTWGVVWGPFPKWLGKSANHHLKLVSQVTWETHFPSHLGNCLGSISKVIWEKYEFKLFDKNFNEIKVNKLKNKNQSYW